jgi:ribosomal protein S17E
MVYNTRSRKNLKLFSSTYQPKKKGRPKGSLSLTNAIKRVLDSVDDKSKKKIIDILAVAATKHAINGNAGYFREVIERVDGKVTNKIKDADKDGRPVKFIISYE